VPPGRSTARLATASFAITKPHTRACPGGAGETFQKHQQPAGAASQSFTRAEVEALRFMLAGLREGKDLRIFARTQAGLLGSLARKAQTMRASINRRNGAAKETTSGESERETQNYGEAASGVAQRR
jgi:hypothetical protein